LYLQTCMNLSVNYFIDKKFKKALEIINYAMEFEVSDYYRDMLSVMKIYRLILFLEMEKMDLLSFAIRNTYRDMLKHMQFHQFEQVVIHTLKQIVKTNSVREQRAILAQTAIQFKELNKSPDVAQVFLMFNFIGWIECRTKQKEYHLLMKHRIKKSPLQIRKGDFC
jgi:hypothetical protein